MSETEAASPADDLANLVLMLLAPMFLWSTNGDIRLAYTAAAQTVNDYRVTNRLSLFTVAKIIAFDIATLSSLSLSMYEDVSMLLALRLRGNANSLDRAGERNRRALEQASRPGATGLTEESLEAAVAEVQRMVNQATANMQATTAPAAEPQPDDAPAPAAEPAAQPAPVPVPLSAAVPAARPSEQPRRSPWADTTTAVAGEFTADLNDLPPDEQWQEAAPIKALTIPAGDPAADAAPPPVSTLAAE